MLRAIGMPELLVILVIALLLFGPKRIPELARSLGTGVRRLKESLTGESQPASGRKKQA